MRLVSYLRRKAELPTEAALTEHVRPRMRRSTFIGNASANDGDGHVFTASPPTLSYESSNRGYRNGKWPPRGTELWG